MGARSVAGAIFMIGVVTRRTIFICEEQLMGHVVVRPLDGAIYMIGVVIHLTVLLCEEQLMPLFGHRNAIW